MYIFGLTGGIGSGKSLVSSYLEELGCPIIDADVIARQVVEPNRPAWKTIVGTFGADILREDGYIDRPKLAKIIFEDDEKRRLLNACTHPFIQKAILFQVIKHFFSGQTFVVLVSPLLFESNRFLGLMKRIVVINCDSNQQLERLMQRDTLSREEALQRINAQMPLADKCRRADFVIDNSKEIRFTQQQVFTLYHTMKRLSAWCGLYRWLITVMIGFFIYKLIFR